MERRKVLKNISLAAGGLITLPAWAQGWNRSSLSFPSFLTPRQDDLLVALVDTIIPTTDTPGAKDLDIHLFVQKMITDCYEPEVQDNLANGLVRLEEMAQQSYNTSFTECSPVQREALLTPWVTPLTPALPSEDLMASEAEPPAFFTLVKELTIRGYMTSEYVMTHHTDYTMVPGHFRGCVPVTA
ncbi:MAG: gluconate 2-dehydrogenase subunit 3 family protein [Cyclobacteriaceae bacterium]